MIRIRIVLLLLAYCIALLGFIPLFLYLEPVPRILFLVSFAAGVFTDYRNRYQPAIVTTFISLAFFTYYALQFNRNNVLSPAANTIILLLGIRLLSEKTIRNHLQIFVLALIALAASSLYNLDAVFLVYLLVQLVLITVSLVLLTFHGKDPQMNISRKAMKKILAAALMMPLATIPLTMLFFIILPRTQHPLWQFIQNPADKVSGFSEKVEPGTASTTVASKTVVFRAESIKLDPQQLYWRGIVLNQVTGTTWGRVDPPPGEGSRVKAGPKVHQMIFPEPSRSQYLITLNIPQGLTGVGAASSGDLIFRKSYSSPRRISYSVTSIPGNTIVVGGIKRKFYLKLPSGISGRMQILARDLKRRSRDDRQIISRLGDLYTDNKYEYITSGLPTGSTSIDTFLFDQRRGNCELFAASAATLLRMAGLPTRMVGGYLGGEYNPIGRYYTVTDDMAHVWLEVYLAGEGWVTVDPTRWAMNTLNPKSSEGGNKVRQLRMCLDLLGYYWNRAVITYDLESQLTLAEAANRNLKQLKLQDLKVPFVLLVLCSVGVVIIPRLWKRLKRTPEEKLLAEFLRVVSSRYGLNQEPGTFGLFELAEETSNPLLQRFVSVYGGAVYTGKALNIKEQVELAHILALIRHGADAKANPEGFDVLHKP